MGEKLKNKPVGKLLLIVGVLIIVAVVGIEASRYPWGILFGVANDAASIADPTPIVLRGEDSGSVLVESSADPTESPAVALPEEALLPGSESADASASVYVKLGIIKIPKLNVSQHVLEGTQRQMRYGLGHRLIVRAYLTDINGISLS